ncbi:MAG: DUF2996 domain-containing protein [Phormidesmis sp.]
MAEEDKSKETADTTDEAAQPADKSADKPAENKATENKSAEDKPAEKKAAKSEDKADSAKHDGAKPDSAKAKKKEKPPKLEDKPFDEFMQQHYLPSLKEAMAEEGIDNLTLEFAKRKLEVMGQTDSEPYWQVQGNWEDPGEGKRQFNIAFMNEDITGQKVFTLASNGAKPSTIEQFMGDERRITLGLMVMYTVQRLNGQKWLTRN